MRRLTTLVLVAGLLTLPALPANAAVTCTFFGLGNFLQVNIGADSDFARVRQQSGTDNLEVRNLNTVVSCGGPTATVDNTNLIVINDNSPSGVGSAEISVENGPLAPGFTGEPGSSDEIEIDINGGGATHFILRGSTGPDRWALGTKGINLNADESTGVDRDITYSGISATDQFTLAGPDRVDGRGGAMTGDMFRKVMQIQSGDGADRLFGGRRDDSLRPEGTSVGYDDRFDGGPGSDEVNYVFFAGPISGNLRTGIVKGAGTDRLTSVQGLFGSDGNDTLTGAPFIDRIWGGDGNDILIPVGGGQADGVAGALGTDTVRYKREERRVVVNLGGSSIGCQQEATGTSIGEDCLFQVEYAVGGRGNDRLEGSSGPNRLVGGPGRDRLLGQAGSDSLDGGRHKDECIGGTELDSFIRCEEAVQ
jgi:Ca2+-binding RTX toxin-like protein